jgi:5-formyltetrahydrofolate cyclo-ligase
MRQTVVARRLAMDPREREAASAVIARRAIETIAKISPATVALYVAFDDESDPRPVMNWALDHDIAVALPVTVGPRKMVFRSHRPDVPLVDGGFKTLAPPASAGECIPDLIVAPLLAFDRQGGRLGWGRGFYDRVVSDIRQSGRHVYMLGIAFSSQEVSEVPMEGHDVRLDEVATELETINWRRKA